jgi:hypothetical protein
MNSFAKILSSLTTNETEEIFRYANVEEAF